MKIKLLSILILISPLSSQAVELYNTYISTRAMGMGNAYTAVVEGTDSIFYNPAGIPRTDGSVWTIADPQVGASGFDALDDFQGLSGGNLASALNNLYGKRVWLGASAKTAVTSSYFAAAYYATTDVSMFVRNPAVPEIETNLIYDQGIAVGIGLPILPMFKSGLVFKRISRTGSRTVIGSTDLINLDSAALEAELLNTGVGFSMDWGMNFMFGTGPVQPALAFVWRNIGNTSFTASGSGQDPPTDEEEMILGGSVDFDAGLINVLPVMELRYLNRSDVQLTKKLHLGVEVGLPLFDLRAGLHQGYYTLGVGMDFGIMLIEAATWGVEMGDYAGQLEDRRYSVQLTFEMNFGSIFDAISGRESGSSGGRSGGRRSRLKQRR